MSLLICILYLYIQKNNFYYYDLQNIPKKFISLRILTSYRIVNDFDNFFSSLIVFSSLVRLPVLTLNILLYISFIFLNLSIILFSLLISFKLSIIFLFIYILLILNIIS